MMITWKRTLIAFFRIRITTFTVPSYETMYPRYRANKTDYDKDQIYSRLHDYTPIIRLAIISAV